MVDAARARTVPALQSAAATTAGVPMPAVRARLPRRAWSSCTPWPSTMLGGLVSLLVVQLFVLPGLLVMTARRRPERLDAEPALVTTD